MRTRRVLVSLFAGALAVTVIGWGCNKQNQGGGGTNTASAASAGDPAAASVAVVNYESVLRDLGWRTKFDADVKAYNEELAKEGTAIKERYNQQLMELQKAITKGADKLTPQQQQELTPLLNQVQQAMYGLQQQANERLNAFRGEWVKRYREALAPITRQVAQQKKYTVVLQQSDLVVYFEPTIDISNAVVDAAKSQPPALVDVPMTALTPPPPINVNFTGPTTMPTTGPTTGPTTKP